MLTPRLSALLAAALFGASTPLAKLLLGRVDPVPLAALLYLGSGLGLLALRALWPGLVFGEAPLRRNDWPWLVGAILAGGVAAPISLLYGLRHTPAATASLLLNFEGAATALLAALVFREAVGRRTGWAVMAVTAASILLSWDPGGGWGLSWGAFGVLGACALWALDNNLTRNLSAKDPLAITTVKGLGAGAFSLLLATALRQPFPPWSTALLALLLGSVSYGASIALFIGALRSLGAARTSALFGTAPFAGALLSLLLFQEAPGVGFLAAALLMSAGASLLLREDHAHPHRHAVLQHEHRHRHDDDGHHTHAHPEGALPAGGVHSHLHTHEQVEHTHPHAPDLHHRHGH
ncbi:MAG TPA: EamA family transporter [Firmicutes bacterium]|nr:EamA family transporter [Bacillota bacterium]